MHPRHRVGSPRIRMPGHSVHISAELRVTEFIEGAAPQAVVVL